MDRPTAACPRRGRRDLQELLASLASPEPVTYWLSVIWLYMTGEQKISITAKAYFKIPYITYIHILYSHPIVNDSKV